MKNSYPTRVGAPFLLLALLITQIFAQSNDRKAPTTPGNLRVTALTPGSVTFAWNPSSDNSGVFRYVIQNSFGQTFQIPQTQTSAKIWPDIPYSWMSYEFFIYAIDNAGNRSKNSNTVSVRFPADVTPPAKPTVAVTSLGPTHAIVAYNTVDDGTRLRYEVRLDGAIRYSAIAETSATMYLLNPGQTYTITVRARDGGGNWSPPSDPVTVTTPLPDPNDLTTPTPPQGLHDNGGPFADGELWLAWTHASDDVTPQNFIRYDLYVNGVWTDSTVSFTRFVHYLELGIVSTLEIYAVDEAGNRSTPIRLTYDMR